MNMRHLFLGSLVVVSLGLGACGGGSSGGSDGGSDGSSLTVTPSLGQVTNATVKLYQSDTTTLLGTGDSGADGVANIRYAGSYRGPVVVAVLGDDDAQYFDEASGSMVPFGAGKVLRAIVPSGTTRVGVTMLTEMAYRLSAENSIGLTDATVNQLNDRVRQALAPELASILTPPTPFDAATSAGSLDDSEAGRYALRLAALAQLGAGDATPALTVAEQLAWDMADGTLDGQNRGSAITGLVYNSTTFASDLAGHLGSEGSRYGNSALQAAVAGYGPISTTIDVADLVATSTLPVAGQAVTMEYCCAAAGSIYNNGDRVLFTFSSSGTLFLTEQYTAVANSFTLRGSEYIWVDDTNGVEYALSLNNGQIHEVNITGIGGSPFYGQFAPASESGGSSGGATLTPGGDGAALAGGNGATGTVGNTRYTYQGHPVPGSALYSYIPTNDTGLFDAFDGTSAITKWSISGFPAAVGSYNCGARGALPAIGLTLNGVPYLAQECVIEIISISTTEVEGRFAAVDLSSGANNLGSVSDGYFRYTTGNTGGDAGSGGSSGDTGSGSNAGGNTGSGQMGGAIQTGGLALTPTVTTFSGSANNPGMADGVGADASFWYPASITTDGTSLFLMSKEYPMDYFKGIRYFVRKIDIASGEVTTLPIPFQKAGSLTTDGTSLYRAVLTGVGRIDPDTGEIYGLARVPEADFSSITTDGTWLYLTSEGSIYRVEIATGDHTLFMNNVSSTLNAITTDGTSLYVADMADNQILKVDIATKATTVLASGNDILNVSVLTCDGDYLYFSNPTVGPSIRRIDLSTGTIEWVAGHRTGQGTADGDIDTASFIAPGSLTTDGKSLFATDSGSALYNTIETHTVRKID